MRDEEDPTRRRLVLGALAFGGLGSGSAAAAPAEEEAAAAGCSSPIARPYGPRAPWNTPVAGLPPHPRSPQMVWRLWEEASNRPGNFNLRLNDYTYPVYEARAATGLFPVRTDWPSNLNGRRMPWNPSWRGAPGEDAQAIVIDPEIGAEWNLFQVSFDGRVVHATNGNRVPGDFRWREQGFAPSRGVGIPYLAMLARGYEVEAGHIPHALAMPVRNTDGEVFVAPGTKLEHPGRMRGGLPEGLRFALNVTDEQIEDWIAALPSILPDAARRSGRAIARALRDYGWFIVDTSGAAGFQLESRLTAEGCWRRAGLEEITLDWRVYPRDLLDGLLAPERIYALAPSDAYPPHLRARPIGPVR